LLPVVVVVVVAAAADNNYNKGSVHYYYSARPIGQTDSGGHKIMPTCQADTLGILLSHCRCVSTSVYV